MPAERPKSDLYAALLPLLNSGRVDLLNIPRLRSQLVGLERRVGRSGRDSIDHAPNSKDDVCNAVAGAVSLAAAAASFGTPEDRVRLLQIGGKDDPLKEVDEDDADWFDEGGDRRAGRAFDDYTEKF